MILDRLAGAAASAVALVNRVTRDPRRPEGSRVPVSSRTLAGVPVTPDSAVTVPAVWASLRYLSQTVAVLPWHVFRDTDAGGEIQKRHPVDWLIFRRPNPEWSSFQFRETLTHWALRWGNGYAEIERDGYDRPIALWPIHPERVNVCRDPETNELYYETWNEGGGRVDIPARDMFHIRGFGEGVVGVNVVAYAAQSIGWARAAQLFGASFFGNGMNVTGVVTLKRKLTEAGFKRLKEELRQLYRGVKGERTAIIDGDADWKPVMIDPEKAQFTEVQKFLVEEVCRWFGVPPHKVMHLERATFSNIEHQAIEVVVDSISPWVKRFEDEADEKLFGHARFRGFYTKMNMNALLRGDTKARMELYRGLVMIGVLSPNDVLRLEDMNTIGPEGDIHVMQEQMATLRFIGDKKEKAAPATSSTLPTPDDGSPDQDEDDLLEDDEATALRRGFELSARLGFEPLGLPAP